ncbi:MAG TPA: DNA repair protein RadC [Gammaproteobacteria bacterium]|nr:DNA repair protein RadC [Gammaproteobacteria bacterium]
MKITQWPLSDRPREKFFSQGVHSLTDSELIAILLQVGSKGKTAVDLARELLDQAGSLKKLSQTNSEQFYQLRGLGKAKYAILKAALELGKRCTSEKIQLGKKLNSSQATQDYLEAQLGDQTREVFACLFLNHHYHILAFEKLFQGSLTEANVYPREVVKSGLAHNAAKIILAHNHPSGNPTPSEADKELTEQLKQALALVDIQVVDHIIVGQQENFSFAEAGWL